MQSSRRRLPSSDSEAPPDKQRRTDSDLYAARGRFKGALMDALEYNVGDSDSSFDNSHSKSRKWGDSKVSRSTNDYSTDDDTYIETIPKRNNKKGTKSSAYVMKLFDRSLDLAQFKEDTPLYTICRAWMANKPRNNSRENAVDPKTTEVNIDGIKLPPPIGHPVSRVPPLLPEQCSTSKLNINLDYNESPPPSKDYLLQSHLERWHSVRKKWLQQAVIYESRYANTQEMLNEMDTE